MDFPVVFSLGPLELPAHLLFELLAYAIAFRIFLRMRRKQGDHLPSETRWTLIVAAIIGAALGSKVLHHLASPTRLIEHWRDPLFLMGGKTLVGALIGGTLLVEIVKKVQGVTRRSGDLYALPLCIGIAIGRIGCFLTGVHDDTVGVETSFFLGMDLGDGLMRHPTPLYEIAAMILLGAWIWQRSRRPHAEGSLFAHFLTGYLVFRFLCDFLKPYEIIFGLRGIQWACILGLLQQALAWRDLRRAGHEVSHDV